VTDPPAPAGDVFTIGHSTHGIDAFVSLLRRHRIAQVVDVRTLPRSRRNPQFDGPALEASLREAGIAYAHLPTVGGLRTPLPGSANDGWEEDAFRGYADHMATPAFAEGLSRLIALASAAPTALMCAEADWRRCHRRLLADALTVAGWRVRHILPRRPDADPGGHIPSAPQSAPLSPRRPASPHPEPHVPTPFLVVENGLIGYPAAQLQVG